MEIKKLARENNGGKNDQIFYPLIWPRRRKDHLPFVYFHVIIIPIIDIVLNKYYYKINMFKITPTILISITTLIIFIITKNPITSPWRLHFALIALVALIIYGYRIKKETGKLMQSNRMILPISIFVILLVAASGWFYSPFFFTLYLLAILLGFIFSSSVSIAFVLTLVVLFSFSIGEVDLTYDFLIVLSLLTVIPLTLYLKKEYLRLKEAEKKILVMRRDEKNYENKVEEILANKINEIAVNLRQPINDTKQIAFVLKKTVFHQEAVKDVDRIIAASEEALRLLKKFEEDTTGQKLLQNPI